MEVSDFVNVLCKLCLGTSSLDVHYLSQSSNPSGNNRSSSVPPRSVGSSLNTRGMDDGDYEIQYIERKLRF